MPKIMRGYIDLMALRGSREIMDGEDIGVFLPYKQGYLTMKGRRRILNLNLIPYKDQFGNDIMCKRSKNIDDTIYGREPEVLGNFRTKNFKNPLITDIPIDYTKKQYIKPKG